MGYIEKRILSENIRESAKDIRANIASGRTSETAYGEPQCWEALENDRSLEITLEQYGLPEEEQFYSFRVHCSEEEFENGAFSGTMGVIDTFNTPDKSLDNLEEILSWAVKVANTDVSYPAGVSQWHIRREPHMDVLYCRRCRHSPEPIIRNRKIVFEPKDFCPCCGAKMVDGVVTDYRDGHDFFSDLENDFGKMKAVRIAESYLILPISGEDKEEEVFREELSASVKAAKS